MGQCLRQNDSFYRDVIAAVTVAVATACLFSRSMERFIQHEIGRVKKFRVLILGGIFVVIDKRYGLHSRK